MTNTTSLPERVCPYCVIAKKEKVQLSIIYPASGNIDQFRKANWSMGGYTCKCCGLSLPRDVFETLIPMLGIIRMDKCV